MKTTLISVDELATLPAHDVLIVDCRFDLADVEKGERDYLAGHLPAAVFARMDGDLSDLSRIKEGLGRHPLPSEAAFSAALGRWGWRAGVQVVCYDAGSGATAAARLWWLLRLAGITDAAVLDGGYAAWTTAGKAVEQSVPQPMPTSVRKQFAAGMVLIDHVLIGKSGELLLDARATPRYRGEVEPIDRVAGHVPGALSRQFTDNLTADGHFKTADVLRREFQQLLHDHDPAQVVHMCGSGVTACHNMLAMEHAGLHGSRLYAPSWSGWVSDPARPIEAGEPDRAKR